MVLISPLPWVKIRDKVFCMLNKFINQLFINGNRTISVFSLVIVANIVFAILICGNHLAEAFSIDDADIRFNTGDIVCINKCSRSVSDLGIETGVNVFSKVVEFFPFISSQTEAVPKDKAEKKGEKTDDNALLHWLYPVFMFFAGLYCSGYFSERTKDIKKPNVKVTGAARCIAQRPCRPTS